MPRSENSDYSTSSLSYTAVEYDRLDYDLSANEALADHLEQALQDVAESQDVLNDIANVDWNRRNAAAETAALLGNLLDQPQEIEAGLSRLTEAQLDAVHDLVRDRRAISPRYVLPARKRQTGTGPPT